jgi:hypothetical protein
MVWQVPRSDRGVPAIRQTVPWLIDAGVVSWQVELPALQAGELFLLLHGAAGLTAVPLEPVAGEEES